MNTDMTQTRFNYTYASVWKRFVAYFLDMVFISLGAYILYSIIKMFALFTGNLEWSDFVSRTWYYFVSVIWCLFVWLYFTLLPISSFSSTFGQLIMGLKQIDGTGNQISYGRANGKFFLSMISKILYIGYFYVFFNPNGQTFHEKVCKTYLVER